MTLARGGSSRRSFGPPGVDAPATPDTGPRPAGPAPPASRCRTVFLEVGQVTHRTIENSGWRAARRDQEARRNEAAARNSPGNGQGDIATPGGSRSGQQEHQDATGQSPGQVPPPREEP